VGTLWSWGNNSATHYELGLGADTADKNIPTQIGSVDTWTQASHGYYHGAGIRADGTLWTWGENSSGELGHNDTTDRNAPTQVGSGTTWEKVVCGYAHTVALKTDGTLWAWGSNWAGQLGQGNTTDLHVPTQIGSGTTWADTFPALDSTFAIKSDGTLWACGDNTDGVLGDGSTTQRENLVQIGAATWLKIHSHSLATLGIKTDGTLWAWGSGGNYKLGLGNTTTYSSPQQIGSATWLACAHGGGYGLAVKADGTLWRWGGAETTPTQVGSGAGWADCWMADYDTEGAAFAVTTAGDLYAFGPTQTYGQMGLGDTAAHALPTRVGSASDWQSLGGSYYSVVAVNAPAVGEYASAPIVVTVLGKTGTAAAPIVVNVQAAGSASAPVRVGVVDSLDSVVWRARVMLGGVDITARVLGLIRVDAEEGAARIAEFAMLPAAGVVDPTDWTGVAVHIDFLRVIGGVEVPARLFTGLVDLAEFDAVARSVAFTCTDDLQNRVSALTRAEIDALVGGRFHVGAQGEIDERWAYAQARLESRPASLDAGPQSGLRVTDWDGLAVWRAFTADDILDATPTIALPRRSSLVNQVDVAYEYRYSRCRERRGSIAWSGTILGTQALAAGYQSPTVEAVRSAVEVTGWHIASAAYTLGWEYIKAGAPSGETEDGDWWIVGTAGACATLTARIVLRYAQPVTEVYTLTVSAPNSLAANGRVAKPLRGALASEWDAQNWESDYTVTTPDASGGDVDYGGAQTRAESDACIQTLVAMAQTTILASHRQGRVSFSVPCLPEADLTQAAEIDTAVIAATGKIARVEHELNAEAGSATTRLTLALSGIAAGGILASPSDLEDVPAPPVIGDITGSDDWMPDVPHLGNTVGAITGATYADTLAGFLVNAPERISYINFTQDKTVSVANPYYVAGTAFDTTGFRVILPGVDTALRDPVDLAQTASYDIAVPISPLTLTV
jgi:alpha-tubulin suppressor-like RCC1 family protein